MLNTLYKGSDLQDELEKLKNLHKTKTNTVTANESKEKKLESDRKTLQYLEDLEEKKTVVEKARSWERFKVTTNSNYLFSLKLSVSHRQLNLESYSKLGIES